MVLRTVRCITGPDRAKWLAAQLIEQSRWFEMTPLPDDLYEFRVKDEVIERLPGHFNWTP